MNKNIFVLMFIGIVAPYLASLAHAEDFYIASTSALSGNASNAANAAGMDFLNTSSNWASPKMVGKIGPGDTVHLTGSFSSALTVLGSGSAGFPITILFEPGARFTAGTWPSSSYAIRILNRSYVTIDGGNNGIIEATDNGEHLGAANSWGGVLVQSGDHITVRRLTVRNVYVRASGDVGQKGLGVRFQPLGTNCEVSDCSISFAFYGVSVVLQGTGAQDLTISGNTITNCGAGINIGDGSSNSQVSRLSISSNSIDHSSVWYDSANLTHADGIHIFTTALGSKIDGVRIVGNTFGADVSAHTTAHIYMEGDVENWMIYNNLFISSDSESGTVSNGAIYAKAPFKGRVFNNTIVGLFSGAKRTIGIQVAPDHPGVIVKNNIMTGINSAIYFKGGTSVVSSDYNNISNCLTSDVTEGEHSNSRTPTFVGPGDYRLADKDTAAVDGGIDLSISDGFAVDIRQVSRPQPVVSGQWDIGAFELIQNTPIVAIQPADCSIAANAPARFTTLVRGALPMRYQWQIAVPTGFQDIVNSDVYSGATTDTLTVTSARASAVYRCVATNTVGSIVSGTAVLNVLQSLTPPSTTAAPNVPTFVTHPDNSIVAPTGTAVFSVLAIGDPMPVYQWMLSTDRGATWAPLTNAAPYAGVSTNTLTVSNVPAAFNSYQFVCVASNGVPPNSTSNVATLLVDSNAPLVTTQPASQTVPIGANATFTVLASGRSPQTYQWQLSTDGGRTWDAIVDGTKFSGSATQTLTFISLDASYNSYQFRCVVTNSISSTTSASATLTVPGPPINVRISANVSVRCSISNIPGIGIQTAVQSDSQRAADDFVRLFICV